MAAPNADRAPLRGTAGRSGAAAARVEAGWERMRRREAKQPNAAGAGFAARAPWLGGAWPPSDVGPGRVGALAAPAPTADAYPGVPQRAGQRGGDLPRTRRKSCARRSRPAARLVDYRRRPTPMCCAGRPAGRGAVEPARPPRDRAGPARRSAERLMAWLRRNLCWRLSWFAAFGTAWAKSRRGRLGAQVLMLLLLPRSTCPSELCRNYGARRAQAPADRQPHARANGMELATGWPMPLLGLDCFVLNVPAPLAGRGRGPVDATGWLVEPMRVYRAEAQAPTIRCSRCSQRRASGGWRNCTRWPRAATSGGGGR